MNWDSESRGRDQRGVDAMRQFANSPDTRRSLAFEDVVGGLRLWRVWVTFGWSDILQRYRRSVLGPFWITASTAIMVVALGVLYAELFRVDTRDFIPFLCVGLLIWSLVSSILNEAGTLFVSYELFIKQIKLPYTLYIWRFVWSKTIMFAHNLVIYVGVLIYFGIQPGWPFIAAIPAFILVLLNGVLVSLYIGMISTRFRDIPQIIMASTQVIFFMTPVLWKPELLGSRRFVADLNPFYHVIEIVRAPMLGQWPTALNVEVMLAVTVLNFIIAALVFPRFRSRIAYWV